MEKDHIQTIHWWQLELDKAEEEVRLIASILKKIHQARQTGSDVDEIPVSQKTSPGEVVVAKPVIKKEVTKIVKEKRKRQAESGSAKINLNLAKVFSVRSKSSEEETYYLLAYQRATE